MSRDHVLHKVRTALGRSAGQPAPPAPPVRLRVPLGEAAPSGPGRVDLFLRNVEGLAGKPYLAGCASAARDYVAELVRGRAAVASNEPLLEEIGITALEGVRSRFAGAEDLRAACASAGLGLTGAAYALADTGTLVMLASRQSRLISLLPPVHAAVVRQSSILSGLDELLAVVPRPAEETASMVLITGPSRTGDIEQILVRGVHGPGEIHVIVIP